MKFGVHLPYEIDGQRVAPHSIVCVCWNRLFRQCGTCITHFLPPHVSSLTLHRKYFAEHTPAAHTPTSKRP